MTIEEVTLPELGEGIEYGEVVSILVSQGDWIEKDQPIIEVESEKAAVEIPSPCSGVVKEILVKEGDRVKVGEAILLVETDAEKKEGKEPEESVPEDQEQEGTEDFAGPLSSPQGDEKYRSVVPAGPAVRRLARELGLDVHSVRGSGPRGRITPEDIKDAARRLVGKRPPRDEHSEEQRETPVRALAGGQPPLPDFSRWGEVTRERMTGLRRQVSKTTGVSWRLIPHVTQFDRADITDLEDQRRALGGALGEKGVKLTVTAIVIAAAALALRKFPRFNASLDEEKEEIVYKNYVNIGVAVDTERGLMVPVIRDPDKKSLNQLALDLTRLAEQARGKQLKPDDMSGASFSVTNLGGLGTTYFTPLVTWPQVAVLGVGRAEFEPVFREGNFVPRRILPLAVSYDHRLIDGADAAWFLRWIAESLEQPLRLLLER